MALPFFSLNKSNIDNFQKLEIPVSGPGDIDLLVVYTGTVVLNWSRGPGDESTIDTHSLEITLEDDFGSLYDLPLAGVPPVATLPPAATFLAVASESSHTQLGTLGLPAENNDWNFQIHPSDNQLEFTTLVTVQGGGPPKSTLVIAANVTNDEGGAFNRIAYQVSVAVKAKPPLLAVPTVCTRLAEYQNPPNQPPFNLTLVHDPNNPNADPRIVNPSSIELVIDPLAPNGANRQLTFTGDAIINFSPSTDDQLTRGTVAIQFLRDLGVSSNFINAAGSATVSSIFNNDMDKDTSYAVDCVQIAAGSTGHMIVPILTAAIVVQGGAGPTVTGLSRITYQANVEILVDLQILVSAFHSAGPPPRFASTASVLGGSEWVYLLTIPTLGPQAVSVASDKPNIAGPIPGTANIPSQSAVFVSMPQSSKNVGAGNSVPVIITAMLGTTKATALLTVFNPG
jgi:hypothetical protein